jgi:hypothetical protein
VKCDPAKLGHETRVPPRAWRLTRRCACIASLVLVWTGEARSQDLRTSAARVAEAWRDAGASVIVGDTRFLNEGETVTLAVPPAPGPSPESGPEPPARACQTVALIGARGLSFQARAGDARAVDSSDERVSSVAGVVDMASCRALPYRFVRVTSDGGRGALETVVARSAAPLASPSQILLERNGGVLPLPPEPGALPPLPAPQKRADVAEARARREGAAPLPREEWGAGLDGKGEGRLVLEAGCHTVELFAPDLPAPRHGARPVAGSRWWRLDLDATMRDAEGQPLAHDHTSAPDARLDVCVGEATVTTVLFEGAPASPVLVTHASLPLPQHLPTAWGHEMQARMATALLPRHVKMLDEDAVFLVSGASGLTPVPIEVEPGGCYVAVAAFEHGRARGLGLRVALGARESFDERGTNDEASAVGFCARDRSRARIDVEARSTGVVWGLALFRVASRIWETP